MKSLNASSIQQRLTEALKGSRSLSDEPDHFIDRVLAGDNFEAASLQHAVDAIYKMVYYQFSNDLVLDDREKRKLKHVIRLLQIDEDRAAALNYDVGLALYAKRFRAFVSDGDLSAEEQDQLDSIAGFFGLHKRDINKAISDQALVLCHG